MNCPRCHSRLSSSNPLLETLSPKQFKMARLIALGHERQEIAGVMGMTAHNVTQQLFKVREKLGVRNFIELTLLMYGLLDQATQEAIPTR